MARASGPSTPLPKCPDLPGSSRRAHERQGRFAPLRGGLRPSLTLAPRGALKNLAGAEKRPFQPNKETGDVVDRPIAATRHSRESGNLLGRAPLRRRVPPPANLDAAPDGAKMPRITGAKILTRFEGTSSFVATDDLKVAVNAAVALQRPLLIKGEPGTGKTVLAQEVANALGKPLISWHIKSTTKAQQGLYEYDAVSRLRDSQLGDARVHDIGNYIIHGKLWDAFETEEAPVLLIDEIDKADIEFPNDLLLELDRMEFFVYETRQTIKARQRPVIIITSNNEKELPDAFLRRCFFHYIKFPDRETMERIVEVHYPGMKSLLLREALTAFYELRDIPGLKKRPSTSEFLDWLKLLMAEDIGPELLREKCAAKLIPPLHGALLKNEQDVHLFERLAFLHRRGG
jgi:MoxR-like ATPase